jgi:hypothetical protein
MSNQNKLLPEFCLQFPAVKNFFDTHFSPKDFDTLQTEVISDDVRWKWLSRIPYDFLSGTFQDASEPFARLGTREVHFLLVDTEGKTVFEGISEMNPFLRSIFLLLAKGEYCYAAIVSKTTWHTEASENWFLIPSEERYLKNKSTELYIHVFLNPSPLEDQRLFWNYIDFSSDVFLALPRVGKYLIQGNEYDPRDIVVHTLELTANKIFERIFPLIPKNGKYSIRARKSEILIVHMGTPGEGLYCFTFLDEVEKNFTSFSIRDENVHLKERRITFMNLYGNLLGAQKMLQRLLSR